MTFPSLLALAIGLAMDATAVAAARGLAAPELRARHFVLVAAFFGGFQALMPLLGWLLGSTVGPSLAAWDHWIAFVLLTGIGGKMLYEARAGAVAGEDDAAAAAARDPFAPGVMLVLAIATSIDAFAAGITLPMFEVPLPLALATIGVTTALLSGAGLVIGRRLGARLGRGLELFGGLVLIGLGVKVLVEHLAG